MDDPTEAREAEGFREPSDATSDGRSTLLTERARAFSAPPLRGRHVHLRAVTADDYGYLHLFETSSELATRWRVRGATPARQAWVEMTSRGILAQFVVVTNNRQPARVGLVIATKTSFQDRYAYLAATRFDARHPSPLFMLGLGIFLNYLFRCFDLRKLYMEVPEYNYPQFASGEGRYFTVEGHLRDHKFLDGRHWDELVLAIYRDRFRDYAAPLLRAEGIE